MIDLLRQHPPAVAWLDSLGEEEIILPGFVVMELLQGCSNKTEQAKVEKVLIGFEIVWPFPETCEAALEVFARYHLSHGVQHPFASGWLSGELAGLQHRRSLKVFGGG
jgi:predicted nucleic acid-binding protein